jgi:CHAD domain-containing protein
VTLPTAQTKPAAQNIGLRYWMLRVLEECDNVSIDFRPDPVHDLRVSLRRCRSLADGLMALDPDPNWKAMKKAGRRLFQRLGDLRDIHVMEEWIEKLDPAKKPGTVVAGFDDLSQHSHSASVPPDSDFERSASDPASSLRGILNYREQEQKREAKAAVEEFDRKQWRQWSKSLPSRATRFRPGSALFQHLALERWTAARELHNRALHNRSQTALHALRIGIKRFRYIVENFLPAQHKLWSADLKEMQDVLGEVHDLDVLWATCVSSHIFPDPHSRRQWQERIREEREKRIERYRKKMVGPNSLWNLWRAELPQGKQIQVLALRRVKLWASALDPDFAHSQHVAGLALQLYDGMLSAGWKPAAAQDSARSTLLAAALLHDIGKSTGAKGHHKSSLELIRKHGTPLGWQESDMQRAAVVARFHCGALPARRHKLLRGLLLDEQKAIMQLAAILRLANAMDAAHDGRIHKLRLENSSNNAAARHAYAAKHKNGFPQKNALWTKNDPLVISADGYSPVSPTARTIAAERHLLETVLHRPVIVKAAKQVANS